MEEIKDKALKQLFIIRGQTLRSYFKKSRVICSGDPGEANW